jgi:outer membrane protein assembly factor BamB
MFAARVKWMCGTGLLLLASTLCHAGDWPQWRGPRGLGVADERRVPLTWSNTEHVQWKVALPEPGNSSPIVVSEKVLLTCPTNKGVDRLLMCFDRRNGNELWRRSVPFAGHEVMHNTNPHCSPSAVSDGERVVAWFGSAGLCCYDLDGKELWRKDLGPFDHIWGYGSSPVIHGDLVFLNAGPGTVAFVAAFHKQTGAEVWRKSFPLMAAEKPDQFRGSWSTPVITGEGDDALLLLSLPHTLRAVRPATGEEVWWCDGLGDLVYTSPLVDGDVVVAMGGYHGPAIACRLGGTGDVTATHRLWRHDQKNPQRIGSGVAVNGHVYILNENGIVWCLSLQSGEKTWEHRLGGTSWGSMCHVDGRLYVQNMQGTVFVLAVDPAQCEVLAENKLGEGSRSSPAFSNGQVFVRTFEALYGIGEQ